MTFERKIKISDRYYYLGVELKYRKDKFLCKLDGTYFDMGDFNIMIDDVEENYQNDLVYDKDNFYMNNIIYLYDRFPFISYIKDIKYDNEGIIHCIGCINKDEIIDYINIHKIEINRWDKNSCRSPLLYE